MNKTVIIMGSSRSNGDTRKIANYLLLQNNWSFIDLLDYKIGHFDYDFKNKDDDFLPLITEIIEQYDTLVFATPVYWYMMSGVMKDFFDRISDLLIEHKELGRKLRGKKMAAVSCSSHDDLVDGFFMPFVETAEYLGMPYLGNVHTYVESGAIPEKVEKRINDWQKAIG